MTAQMDPLVLQDGGFAGSEGGRALVWYIVYHIKYMRVSTRGPEEDDGSNNAGHSLPSIS